MIVSINGNKNIMKKINQVITSSIATLGIVLMPAVAVAQDVPTVEVDTTNTTTTSETTAPTTATAGVPATGIAPKPSNLMRNSAVFIIGGAIGSAIGVGIVSIKRSKSRANQ